MWYVLQTEPLCESRVSTILDLRGFETCVPEFTRPRRTRPGSVRDGRHRRVFPGYVFFTVPSGFAAWHVVRRTPGVRRLLEQDGEPAALEDTVMAALHERIAAASLRHSGSAFRHGQTVRIEQGPLAMVDALFDRCLDATDRVRILVHLLGRRIPVELDPLVLRAAG